MITRGRECLAAQQHKNIWLTGSEKWENDWLGGFTWLRCYYREQVGKDDISPHYVRSRKRQGWLNPWSQLNEMISCRERWLTFRFAATISKSLNEDVTGMSLWSSCFRTTILLHSSSIAHGFMLYFSLRTRLNTVNYLDEVCIICEARAQLQFSNSS